MIDKGNKDASNKEHPINIYKSAFDRLKTIPRSRNQNKYRSIYWKSHKNKVKIVTNTSHFDHFYLLKSDPRQKCRKMEIVKKTHSKVAENGIKAHGPLFKEKFEL